MRILITRGGSPLGAALANALAGAHEVVILDLPDAQGEAPLTFAGDIRDRAFATEASRDCDAIVHLLPSVDPTSRAEDILDMATRGTYNLAITTSATRFILLSSLRIFERYPPSMLVNEYWAPRPSSDVADLAPYLAEVTLREVSRVLPLQAIALRLGNIFGPDDIAGRTDSRSLHRDDAVQAVERALVFEPTADEGQTGWWVFHIPGTGERTRFPLGQAGQSSFGYQPQHDVTGDTPALASAPDHQPSTMSRATGGAARRVVIFGAGGPLAAATTEALAHDHVLRLADLRPLEQITEPSSEQRPDAPVPRVLDAPHETQIVDITDAEQVLGAARGMDAIINSTVLRHDPVEAFRVNMLGAYNVMRAAVACGIRRVVHTGPFQAHLPYPAGYWYDYDIVDDVPARPGTNLYLLTKLLGQEICRIFAHEHALEVPTLLFCQFVNPLNPLDDPLGLFPFSVSWDDSAEAMRLALRAPSFPHPFEVFHILADLPHGKYTNEKAKRLLSWQPRDRLERYFVRSSPESSGSG